MNLKGLEDELRKLYTSHNQEHVFDHYSSLDDEKKSLLLKDLSSFPVDKLASYLQSARQEQDRLQQDSHEGNDHSVHIGPYRGSIGSVSTDSFVSTMEPIGIHAIAINQLAVVLLAGGQGTRLGFDGPKGIYDLGLKSGRTLFQLISERLVKLIQLVNERQSTSDTVSIPLYIMTSPMNHEATRSYFESHNFFGLSPKDVLFFEQGVLPCLSINNGKILMEEPGKVAVAPDGNGGIYPAMERCGIFQDMEQRGIQFIHVFSIDNCLVKPADPVFLGYCISQGADCGNKVLWKAHAHEKVGVMAEKDGRPCVVEYSELSSKMAEMIHHSTGKLMYGAANICNHFYTLDFLQNQVLPNMKYMYHMALKKIPIWDEEKQQVVAPEKNNGIKLESFIFDVFSLSTNMTVMEVLRDVEFSPVKNAPGSETDSPETARRMISELSKKWLQAAGAKLIGDLRSDDCEVSPLLSYGGEGLHVYRNRDVVCPFNI